MSEIVPLLLQWYIEINSKSARIKAYTKHSVLERDIQFFIFYNICAFFYQTHLLATLLANKIFIHWLIVATEFIGITSIQIFERNLQPFQA